MSILKELSSGILSLDDLILEGAHLKDMKLSKATVGSVGVVAVPGEEEKVMLIRIDSDITESLVEILGVPADGTAYKIRTGFMVYDKQHKTLFFSKKKFSLPKIKD